MRIKQIVISGRSFDSPHRFPTAVQPSLLVTPDIKLGKSEDYLESLDEYIQLEDARKSVKFSGRILALYEDKGRVQPRDLVVKIRTNETKSDLPRDEKRSDSNPDFEKYKESKSKILEIVYPNHDKSLIKLDVPRSKILI